MPETVNKIVNDVKRIRKRLAGYKTLKEYADENCKMKASKLSNMNLRIKYDS